MAKVKSKIIQNGNVNYVYATLNGIDTSNVIASGIKTYTAQQDCFAVQYASSSGYEIMWFKVDGIEVQRLLGDSDGGQGGKCILPVKKGQTITTRFNTTYYGIKR